MRTFASSPPRAVAADTAPSANQIIHDLNLAILGKAVVGDAKRIASQNAAGSVKFSQVLQAVATFVAKDSIAGFLVSLGLGAEQTSCEQGLLYMRARPAFALVANVLGLVSRAQPGPNRPLFTKILDAQKALNKLKTFILRVNLVGSQCEGPNKVALATINRLYPALAAAEAHLKALAAAKPSPKECKAAIKVLTAYARILNDKGKKLSPKKKKELDAKRNAGTITSKDLPGGLDFPGGQLEGETLNRIRELCK